MFVGERERERESVYCVHVCTLDWVSKSVPMCMHLREDVPMHMLPKQPFYTAIYSLEHKTKQPRNPSKMHGWLPLKVVIPLYKSS